MKDTPNIVVVNRRIDYTGTAVVICLLILVGGYLVLQHFAGYPSAPKSATVEARFNTAAYEAEKARLVDLQNDIIRIHNRYVDLDPRMKGLRDELYSAMRTKFEAYKLEYAEVYEPLLQRSKDKQE